MNEWVLMSAIYFVFLHSNIIPFHCFKSVFGRRVPTKDRESQMINPINPYAFVIDKSPNKRYWKALPLYTTSVSSIYLPWKWNVSLKAYHVTSVLACSYLAERHFCLQRKRQHLDNNELIFIISHVTCRQPKRGLIHVYDCSGRYKYVLKLLSPFFPTLYHCEE